MFCSLILFTNFVAVLSSNPTFAHVEKDFPRLYQIKTLKKPLGCARHRFKGLFYFPSSREKIVSLRVTLTDRDFTTYRTTVGSSLKRIAHYPVTLQSAREKEPLRQLYRRLVSSFKGLNLVLNKWRKKRLSSLQVTCRKRGTMEKKIREKQKRNAKYKMELIKKITPAEASIRAKLKNAEIYAIFQKGFIAGNFHCIVDFYLPKYKLCIEVDGLYHLSEKQREKDKRKDNYLEGRGFRVLRIMNSEALRIKTKELKRIIDAR